MSSIAAIVAAVFTSCTLSRPFVHLIHGMNTGRRATSGNPRHDEIDGFRLLPLGKRDAQRYLPPFVKAPPAASRRRMLCDKHRMTFHWRLPSVVLRIGWRKAKAHEIRRMPANRLNPLLSNIPLQFRSQAKPSPERGPAKPCKRLFICHVVGLITGQAPHCRPLPVPPNPESISSASLFMPRSPGCLATPLCEKSPSAMFSSFSPSGPAST